MLAAALLKAGCAPATLPSFAAVKLLTVLACAQLLAVSACCLQEVKRGGRMPVPRTKLGSGSVKP